MDKANAQYHMVDWNETAVIESSDGTKVTRVEASFRYEGVLNGETRLVFHMLYETESIGRYEGYERFDGSYDGETASMWLAHRGHFDAEGVEVEVESVPDTPAGSLNGKHVAFKARYVGHGPYAISVAVE